MLDNNIDSTEEEVLEIAIDSMVVIEISADQTIAYLLVTEPRHGGAEVVKEDILSQIDANDIKYGLDLSVIDELIEKKIYNKKLCIAKGFLPIAGENGYIKYLFEPTSELAPKKNKMDIVDYKDLGLIKNTVTGTVIAEIKESVPGTDGMDVKGKIIPQPPLVEAKYQIGAGTQLSDDETKIIASIDGNLCWQRDRFVVEETLIIKGDVDVSTGNIDFIGNIIIKGEVKENFKVISKKNITINTSAIGATVIADGDVVVGMGSINSDIISKGNMKIGFCEGSKIECGGDLTAQTFISSNIYCSGVLRAITGKGVVVGGKVTALEGADVNIVGSESFIKTRITLGNGAVLQEEMLDHKDRIKELNEHIRKLLQVAEILQEHKKNFGQLSADREAMLTTAIRSRFTFQREIKQRNSRINEIEIELLNKQEISMIIRKQIWPGSRVRIGTDVLNVEERYSRCIIGYNPTGELGFLPLK